MENEKGWTIRTDLWVTVGAVIVALTMIVITTMPVAMAGKPTKPTPAFNTSTIDTIGDVGFFTHVALDSHNNVYITYYDVTNYALKFATNIGGPWHIEIVQIIGSRYNPAGAGAEIALDSNDIVHITYIDINNELIYAKLIDGGWVKTSLDSDVMGDTGLAIDKNDDIHITYWEDSNSELPTIQYVHGSPGAWMTETVATHHRISWSPSLAMDSDGVAHIAYSNLDDNKLTCVNSADGWDHPQYPDPDVTFMPRASIAIDPDDNLHLIYFIMDSQGGRVLRYADNVSGSWNCQTIDSSTDKNVHWTAMDIDSVGRVHICYSDYASGSFRPQLMYAMFNGAEWQVKIVDTVQNVGQQNSIAVGSDFIVHMSYLDSNKKDLKYAKSF